MGIIIPNCPFVEGDYGGNVECFAHNQEGSRYWVDSNSGGGGQEIERRQTHSLTRQMESAKGTSKSNTYAKR